MRVGQVGHRGRCSISRLADIRPLAIPLSQRLHIDSGPDFYFGFLAASLSQQCSGAGSHCELPRKPSNQSMKPTAPLRCTFSVLATTPCRGLSPSR